MREPLRWALLLVLVAALLLLPTFAEKYYIQFATKILIMGIFAMSLDLLDGYTGHVSLGHAAFYGLGAYVLAMGHRLPAATVVHFIANEDSWVPSLKLQQICIEAGFPLFLSMTGVAKAIRRLMDFDRAHPGMLAAVHQEGG